MRLKHSLNLQLFALVAGLCLLTVTLIALVILPKVEARIRTLDHQLSQAKMDQTELTLSLSHQFSTALDALILKFHEQEIEHVIEPHWQLAQRLQSALAAAPQRPEFVAALIQYLEQLPHLNDTHIWLTDGKGTVLYHPHMEQVLAHSHHQKQFSVFIDRVKKHGQASAQLPWLHGYIVDTKPVTAYHLSTHNLIIGADVSVKQLSQAPLKSYENVREIMQKILDRAAFGNHGQMFFFFPDHDYLLSGTHYDLEQVLMQKINPDTGNLYAEDFKRASRIASPLKLLWNQSHDPDNFIYPAVAHVSHIADREVYLVSITYPDDLNQQALTTRYQILTTLLAVLIASVSAAWWLSRRIVRPILSLSDFAKRVGSGHLELRSNLQREDELGLLAASIDSMVQQLQDTIAGLDQTVAERTTKLNRQNQQLGIALKDQQALLREVHHRVKNNLSVIIGFIQLQQRRLKDNPETYTLLRDLRGRVYTIELIHNLLYRVENYSDIHCSEYYQALLQEIWQLHNPTEAIQYRLNVQLVQQPLEQLVNCGQILNELVSNALKYAFRERKAGLISITIETDEQGIVMSVVDDGCGFANHQELPQSGLGLTLVQHLVKSKLHGEIQWLSSPQGVTWQLRFPASYQRP